jgi:hypothetical protein
MKAKKSKPPKPPKQTPFDVGFDAEQLLADTLCNQYLEKDQDELDEAFIAAFSALSYRMCNIFNKEYIFKIVAEEALAAENDAEPHVCKDCQDEQVNAVSDEDRKKMH